MHTFIIRSSTVTPNSITSTCSGFVVGLQIVHTLPQLESFLRHVASRGPSAVAELLVRYDTIGFDTTALDSWQVLA